MELFKQRKNYGSHPKLGSLNSLVMTLVCSQAMFFSKVIQPISRWKPSFTFIPSIGRFDSVVEVVSKDDHVTLEPFGRGWLSRENWEANIQKIRAAITTSDAIKETSKRLLRVPRAFAIRYLPRACC